MSVETYRLYLDLVKRVSKLEKEVEELRNSKEPIGLEGLEKILTEEDHREIAERIKIIESIPDETIERIITMKDLYKMEEESGQGNSCPDEYLKRFNIKSIDFAKKDW